MTFRRFVCVPAACLLLGLTLPIFLAGPPMNADEKKHTTLTPADVFKRASPAVVAIDCLGDKNAKIATASGFIISDNGRIATNFHVIKSCQNLLVRLTNGDVYDTTWVIAVDARRDLAIIRIKAASLRVLPLAESNDIEVGQTVYSLGNPNGLQNTIQQGLVSAFREQNGSRLVQVSASINPGNSGGPILDEQGHVIAIAVSKISGAENLGFAIPIDYLKGYLDSKEETAFAAFAAQTNPAPLGFQQFYKCVDSKAHEAVDLGDTVTPAACLAACKKQDNAARCWWMDGSGFFPRDCHVCKTLAPVKMVWQNDWAIAIGTNVVGDVPGPTLPDAGATVRWIAPIYSQLLTFSFPRGFKRGDENVNGLRYIQQLIPEGETLDNWTRMVTVTGAKSLASKPNFSPKMFAEGMAGRIKERCPNSFSTVNLIDGKIGGYDGFAFVFSCGLSPTNGGGMSESTLVAVIKGDSDYYTVQWSETAEPSSTPIVIDRAKWLESFKRLEPIKLCPIVPREAAPYPSCVGTNTPPARAATTPPPAAIDRDARPGQTGHNQGNVGSGDAQGTLAHAKELFNAKRFSEALALFRESASSGNAEAQRYVGDAYDNGWGGVTQDYTQARQWYEKAAANGNAVAANNLGVLYYSGHGVAQDYTQARAWYEKSASAGGDGAMSNLGFLYEHGLGVAQDYTQARQWYEKGAAAGSAAAMGQLGSLYEHGLGVAQAYTQAHQWYEKAAAGGNPIAMNNLGALYYYGHGVAQDYTHARALFEKAAAAGYAGAMNNLGSLYEHGKGVAQDYTQARQWYEKAAAAGNTAAKANLEKLPK